MVLGGARTQGSLHNTEIWIGPGPFFNSYLRSTVPRPLKVHGLVSETFTWLERAIWSYFFLECCHVKFTSHVFCCLLRVCFPDSRFYCDTLTHLTMVSLEHNLIESPFQRTIFCGFFVITTFALPIAASSYPLVDVRPSPNISTPLRAGSPESNWCRLEHLPIVSRNVTSFCRTSAVSKSSSTSSISCCLVTCPSHCHLRLAYIIENYYCPYVSRCLFRCSFSMYLQVSTAIRNREQGGSL